MTNPNTQPLRLRVPIRARGLSFRIEGRELKSVNVTSGLSNQAKLFTRCRNWVGVQLDSPVESGATIELELELLAGGDCSPQLPEESIRWIEAPPDAESADGDGTNTTADLYALSQELADNSVHRLALLYFTELDKLTNPEFANPPDDLAEYMRALMVVLRDRIFARAYAHNSSSEPALVGYDAIGVRRVSSLMTGLLAQTYAGSLTDPACARTIGLGHDVFSWGGLRLIHPPGIHLPNAAPNGAAIFMFPEFAQLAISSEADVEVWRALLPALTRMPAIYLHIHEITGCCPIPQAFDNYSLPPEHNVPENQLQAFADELALRMGGFDEAALGAELGRLAARAFTLTQTKPLAFVDPRIADASVPPTLAPPIHRD